LGDTFAEHDSKGFGQGALATRDERKVLMAMRGFREMMFSMRYPSRARSLVVRALSEVFSGKRPK